MFDARSVSLRLVRHLTSNFSKLSPCCGHSPQLYHNQPEQSPLAKNRCIDIPEPQLNLKRLCDPTLTQHISENIRRRKGRGNIDRVIALNEEYHQNKSEVLRRELIEEALCIPNDTHPEPSQYGEQPKVIKLIGKPPHFPFLPKNFDSLMEVLNVYRMDSLARFAGHRAYYFIGELAELEQALIRFSLKQLVKRGFKVISVPDLLHHQIIESCGFPTKGDRTQVYRLDPEYHNAYTRDGDVCLSGTAEMALGGYLMNRLISEKNLPLRLASVSRCYRAEGSYSAAESGLYRVHQFTKVEMFGATTENASEELFEEFRTIQEEIFSLLELHLQVLDMPSHELGAPAYRKYDLEAWLPGRKMYGEVSSCSDCTDFQSRRLNIQYESLGDPSIKRFVGTVNGTACAIPRLIIALCETHQQSDGTVSIPPVLRPYMRGKEKISKFKQATQYGKIINRYFRRWSGSSRT